MELLRFTTAGSVDDGKSTLIGRLLYDSKAIFDDQLDALHRASLRRGEEQVNLALLTDGLRAEREQGITIDVAYRYFATPKRSFIIADTPGHVQYTRNMVTGASTAQVAVILVDARQGVVEQTRRHAYLAALLGLSHIVFAINKMDLVGYEQAAFERVKTALEQVATHLAPTAQVHFLPIAALHGDNVVERSDKLTWYSGPTLLELLETLEAPHQAGPARFPVQYVIRPQSPDFPDYRGYAGRVVGAPLHVGERVVALPSGLETEITGIETMDGPLEIAEPGQSVTVRVKDDLDLSRGDLLAPVAAPPTVAQELTITLCWLATAPLRLNARYKIRHTSREVLGMVTGIDFVVDIETLEHIPADGPLTANTIAQVRLRLAAPLFVDDYTVNRTMGSLILIDEASHVSVGAGMIVTP